MRATSEPVPKSKRSLLDEEDDTSIAEDIEEDIIAEEISAELSISIGRDHLGKDDQESTSLVNFMDQKDGADNVSPTSPAKSLSSPTGQDQREHTDGIMSASGSEKRPMDSSGASEMNKQASGSSEASSNLNKDSTGSFYVNKETSESSESLLEVGGSVEEVMDYRTYCETIAGLLQKPIVKLLRNLKVSRNVKWIYQEGIPSSGRCSLACFNGKLQ